MRAAPPTDPPAPGVPSTATVVLCGFMGVGKTAVGRELASCLGRPFADADAVIEARAGLPIPTIFERHGEAGFRAMERAVCRELADAGGVVAVGGGAVVAAEDRAALARRAVLVCLDADEAALAARLDGDAARPLAAGGAWRRILAERRPAYQAVALHVDTTRLAPAEVAQRVTDCLGSRPAALARRRPVPAPDGEYGMLAGAGLLAEAGRLLAEHGLPGGRVAVVTDAGVGRLHAAPVRDALAAAGRDAVMVEVPAGEAAKTLEELERVYGSLAGHGLGRDGVVLGLGGGAIGDLAGFAAATWLRGVPYVAAPTTLLAMVDAAIGGKTGVNLPAGKNLVGSFASPRLVLADTATLATLPTAEWRAGLAEVVKHALIGDPALLDRLESDPRPPLDPPAPADAAALAGVTALVERAAAVKIAVVAEDFREEGRRETLNLGHTFAHGFERASGWGVRHGDAVAVGLVAACRVAAELGLAAPSLADRVERLLVRLGLPVRLELDAVEVLAAMGQDKKRRAGRLRLALPERPGSVLVREVPDAAVLRRVVDGLLGHG
jgi:shikimate kinase / 3-dehydroquinate synthase